ncbi:MAG: carbonic anhydrase family protein [Silvanigrellales bacterium]|nr:carbonic anhydrase family protein [Silvanigrellales bacterium]
MAFVASAGVAVASNDAPWGYSGKKGPKSWGHLNEAYRLCERGTDQSPIDLRDAAPGEGDKLRFEYFPSPLSVWHNGHTIQVDVEKGSSFQNGRGRFELKQFHFHTPSEHTRDGKSFPLEIHLVHSNAEGALAVVGILVELGKRHPALDAVFENMPAKPGKKNVEGLFLNARALLPRKGGYDFYPGSLTTPPCSEGVSWHVLKTPLEISKQQLDAFRKVFKMNARPVQPLRDRVLREM